MPSHRYYCPALQPGVVELPPEEAHHAAAVMRAKSGNAVELFDGAGQVASGTLDQVSKRRVTASIEHVSRLPFDLRHRLTLAVAMSKAHRQGYLVEKCTELGVAAIWPIVAERSVTRPGDAAVEKWSRRAIEACKQSGRAWVPAIAPVMTFPEALAQAGQFALALFADFEPRSRSLLQLLEERSSAAEILAFVGPEGGWSADERRTACTAGLLSVSLSPTVLRAETAAVALCAAVCLSSV